MANRFINRTQVKKIFTAIVTLSCLSCGSCSYIPFFNEIKNQFIQKEREDDVSVIVEQSKFDVLENKLKFSFDIDKKILYGDVRTTFRVRSDTLNKVYLNFYDNMEINFVKSDGENLKYERDNDYIIINKRFNKNDTAVIEIKYHGTPETKGFDSFLFTHIYGASNIFSLSEPNYAPTWWPCKDRIDDKFLLSMEVEYPDTLMLATQGKLIEIKEEDGFITEKRKSEYPIATYLVSLNIGKFKHWSDIYTMQDSLSSMPVSYYAFPDYYEDAKADWERTPEMINYFSSIFGEYPFTKEGYGMSMFGWTSGAMEHQTISSMGYNTVSGDKTYENVVVHELTHQWFGDAVTPVSWKDIWLNEGFATYGEALWEEHNKGTDALARYMEYLDKGFFYGTVYNPKVNLFGTAVYNKGAWCLHMLRGVTGDSTFFKILREYYTRYKYKNASTYDFRNLCEEIYGKKLDWFFNEWIFEWIGRPEYEYSVTETGPEFTFKVKQTQPDDVYIMPIRLEVKTDASTKIFTFFNDKREQEFTSQISGKIREVNFDKGNFILKTAKKIITPN